MATQVEIAEHLDLSDRRVRDLVRQGILPAPRGRGGLDLDACRFAYLGYLRALATGQSDGDNTPPLGDLEQERTRLTKAQADHEELKVQTLRGTLIPAEVVERVQGAMVIAFRSRMLALPSKAVAMLQSAKEDSQAESILTDLVHEGLEELSEFDPEPYAHPDGVPVERPADAVTH